MLLSINPPISLLGIPEELLSYSVTFAESAYRTSKTKGKAVTPYGWTAQKQFCRDNNVQVASVFCLDHALWRSQIIETVRFDISECTVEIDFIDDTHMEFTFAELDHFKPSSPTFIDSDSDDEQTKSFDFRLRPSESLKPALLGPLEELLQIYRTESWDDHPHYAAKLAQLSFADARKIIFATNRAKFGPSAKQKAASSSVSTKSIGEPKPSQKRRLDSEDPLSTDDPFPSFDPEDAFPRPESEDEADLRPADELKVIAKALCAVRTTMVECFQLHVLPLLRERLPPSFALWKVQSQLRALRYRIVELAGNLGEALLEHDVAGRRRRWSDLYTERRLDDMKDWCSHAIRRSLIQQAFDLDSSSIAETVIESTVAARQPGRDWDDEETDELAEMEEVDIPVHPSLRPSSCMSTAPSIEEETSWKRIFGAPTLAHLDDLVMAEKESEPKESIECVVSDPPSWAHPDDIPVSSSSPEEQPLLRTPSLSPPMSPRAREDFALTEIPDIIDCELIELIPSHETRDAVFQLFMDLRGLCDKAEDMDVTRLRLEDLEEQKQLEQASIGLDRHSNIADHSRVKSPLGISQEQQQARTRTAQSADRAREKVDASYVTSKTRRLEKGRDAFRRDQAARALRAKRAEALRSSPPPPSKSLDKRKAQRPSGLSRQVSVNDLDVTPPVAQRPRLVRSIGETSVHKSKPSDPDLFDENALIVRVDGGSGGNDTERAVRTAHVDENAFYDRPFSPPTSPPRARSPPEIIVPRMPLAARDLDANVDGSTSSERATSQFFPGPPATVDPWPTDPEIVDMDLVGGEDDAQGEDAEQHPWHTVSRRF